MNRDYYGMPLDRHEKGFTLVEIAIVLVIVGLLIGGVLKGQALIGSAKNNNMINKLQALQTAYYGFQDKYAAIPGDMSNASTIIGAGAVNCSTRCDNGQLNGWQNASLALNHLAAAGLYSGPAPDAEQNRALTTLNAPDNAYGGAMFIRFWNQVASEVARTNQNAVFTGRNVPAEVLAEIDRKIDDGKPQSGTFRAAWPNANGGRCYDNANNEWNIGGTDCGGALLF